jgi:putative glutamine amidotransferase
VRPLVGITAYVETVHSGDWHRAATLLPQQYVTAVHAAGGRAVVLPPAVEGADRVVAALDALILAGGADLDPARYGAEPEPATTGLRPDRDAGELALLAAAAAADLPVLGICRGMQLMVAAGGGRLHQHLPDLVGHHRHRQAPGRYGDHPVRTGPGTVLAGLIGPHATVPSYHHQGVADPGVLTVSAWADDGTIEGVERPAARFWLGVLWHPEAGDDPRLFGALVAAAGHLADGPLGSAPGMEGSGR